MSLSESVRDLQVALNTIVNLKKELNDKKLIDTVTEAVKRAQKVVSDATGGALLRLNVSKPSIDTVKELIHGIPDALSFNNEKGQLPVQSALWDIDSIKYLPVLANEGTKLEVGGRGMRGGLLAVDPTSVNGKNTLQLLVVMEFTGNSSDPIPCGPACLDALKELRGNEILLKWDIKEQNLLLRSCVPHTKMRFEYLAEWDPDCLMTDTYQGLPLSHAVIRTPKTRFTIFLTTSLKHHPQHLGLLFQKDSSGKTAYERAIEKHGNDYTINTIAKTCIPTDTHLPILHHVIKDAPKHINAFSSRYLSAMYLRDEDGRSFKQAAIASGSTTVKNDGLFFAMMTDDDIAELDPVTNQYPFLTSAACKASDLSTVYVLLSKNPSLLEKYIEQTTDEFAEEARMQTRIRDSNDDEGAE